MNNKVLGKTAVGSTMSVNNTPAARPGSSRGLKIALRSGMAMALVLAFGMTAGAVEAKAKAKPVTAKSAKTAKTTKATAAKSAVIAVDAAWPKGD